jgi:antitoxin ChpS
MKDDVAMYTTKLRKSGGSVILAVPPALLDTLGLSAEKVVSLDVRDDELIVRRSRRRYTLEELLAQGEAEPLTDEDRAWLEDAPAGREQI